MLKPKKHYICMPVGGEKPDQEAFMAQCIECRAPCWVPMELEEEIKEDRAGVMCVGCLRQATSVLNPPPASLN